MDEIEDGAEHWVFIINAGGGRIYCDVPVLIGLKDTYMTVYAPILVLNS